MADDLIALNVIIKIIVILYCFNNLIGKGKKMSLQIGMEFVK